MVETPERLVWVMSNRGAYAAGAVGISAGYLAGGNTAPSRAAS